MGKPSLISKAKLRQRTAEIRRAIAALDFLCSGTLLTRTKLCGRAGCRCATDPEARHGPYYEWSRREHGRLVHSVVAAEQAAFLKLAISNYSEVKRLLVLWERETAAEILSMHRKTP
jgi:hypothetical protein